MIYLLFEDTEVLSEPRGQCRPLAFCDLHFLFDDCQATFAQLLFIQAVKDIFWASESVLLVVLSCTGLWWTSITRRRLVHQRLGQSFLLVQTTVN